MPHRLWRRKGAACGPLRALAPPPPPRRPDEVFGEKTASGKAIDVQYMKCLKLAGASLLLAAFVYAMLAAPGFLTDTASTVPLGTSMAAVRP